MGVPFDHITTVDQDLSKTAVSQLQRKIVWKYLDDVMPQLKGYDILELSVGAPEDAELFGDDGFNILATDVGSETAKVTNTRATTFSMSHDITSKYLDVDAFDETVF